MTDTELKQALAEMLPELIDTEWMNMDSTEPQFYGLIWKQQKDWPVVKDTELLHLCWLVETQQIPDDRWMHYASSLGCVAATWQQRVKALMKVKNL